MYKYFYFTTAEIELLRSKVREISCVEKLPIGWSKSTIDAKSVLEVFHSLYLKKGIVLQAYVWRDGIGGYGIVWAMPEDSDYPDPQSCQMTNRPNLGLIAPRDCPKSWNRLFPRPARALDHVMDAIEGDGTAWSYVSASIFAREITELGAWWHGLEWSTHCIIDENPFDVYEKRREHNIGNAGEWKWNEPKPHKWLPKVVVRDRRIDVTFYTYTENVIQAIYRNIDIFHPGRYFFNSHGQQIAKGPGGYIL